MSDQDPQENPDRTRKIEAALRLAYGQENQAPEQASVLPTLESQAGSKLTLHLFDAEAEEEAVLKVLGTGWRGPISWTDIEITNDSAGKPSCTLSGPTLEIAQRQGIEQILITLTHTQNYASASALGVGA